MRGARRAPWLIAAACALFGVVIWMLWVPTTGEVLGTTVACGNLVGVIVRSGASTDSITSAVCGPGWAHTAAIGSLALVAGIVTLIVGLVWRRPSQPPGWYPSTRTAGLWDLWDGRRLVGEPRVPPSLVPPKPDG
jgi:hypothetical protein